MWKLISLCNVCQDLRHKEGSVSDGQVSCLCVYIQYKAILSSNQFSCRATVEAVRERVLILKA